MTHFHSKRLPRGGAVLAAVVGLLAAPGLGAAGEANAATTAPAAARPAASVAGPAASVGPTATAADHWSGRWTDRAHGFASLAGGTTGGAGGKVVTVTGQAALATSDAPRESFHLGRPWHPGGEPEAVAQVLIRDTELPAAVKSAPWTDMSGFSWRDARFAEYRDTGPGATPSADRPQLSDEDARSHTVADCLRGTDGWAPYARTTH